jgi:phosphopantothenoylcysteine decarboxylase/phosphopantothenate--cysteine ligase
MATTAPILLSPAMNTGMWDNAATTDNIQTLRQRGYRFVEPVAGRLACRTEGMGKLAEVDEIFEAVQELLAQSSDLAGRRILITAGPTREPLDPVRFLTNRSSGRMGYALAERARDRGAKVVLVTGPTSIPIPMGVSVIPVGTAEEMSRGVLSMLDSVDAIIGAAAVADFKPAKIEDRKIKKGASSEPEAISLTRTPDIMAEVGKRRKPGQVLVGFAAETDRVVENAEEKLCAKSLDWIVANDVSAEGAGFDVDTNIVTILGANGARIALPKLTKREVADRILDAVFGSQNQADKEN